MYDGTLYGHWQAIVTFQQMIVLADADGIVDMTPQAMSARTSIPFEIIEAGLKKLEAPDPYSRTPGNDGKRIELIDEHRPWGWHIVNHEKYKKLRDADEVRAQNRERQQRFRDKKHVTERNAASREVTACNTKSRHTDTYTDTRKEAAAKDAALDPIWGVGLDVLLQGGVREDQARSFIGLQLASWKSEDVLEALQAASGKADPRSYVRGVLRTKPKKGQSSIKVDL